MLDFVKKERLLLILAVQYLGCYEDKRERDLGSAWLRFDEENSIEKCAQECSKRGNEYNLSCNTASL